MIFAEIRGAVGADAVFLDAHAIDVEPANDRTAGRAWREARSGDAGLVEEKIAEGGGAIAAQFGIRHHGHGGKLIGNNG
jgi:hypothetical protein